MKIYVYQPGNGTRYELYVEQINDMSIANVLHINPGGWFVGWVGGQCYSFQPNGYLDMGYVAEKFKVNEADGMAITQFLAHIMDRKVKPVWPKCLTCGMPRYPKRGTLLCAGCEPLD